MPAGLPDPGATPQQDMAVPPVNDLPLGLQAPAQAAIGCSGAPKYQARLSDIMEQAYCLAFIVVLALHAQLHRSACLCIIVWLHLPGTPLR